MSRRKRCRCSPCEVCGHTLDELQDAADESLRYDEEGPYTFDELLAVCKSFETMPINSNQCECEDQVDMFIGIFLSDIIGKFPPEEMRLVFTALTDETHPDHSVLWHGINNEGGPVKNSLEPPSTLSPEQIRVFLEFKHSPIMKNEWGCPDDDDDSSEGGPGWAKISEIRLFLEELKTVPPDQAPLAKKCSKAIRTLLEFVND